jgi:uncharacterized protein (TIGR02231 family)
MCKRVIKCFGLLGLAALFVWPLTGVSDTAEPGKDSKDKSKNDKLLAPAGRVTTSRVAAVTVYPTGALVTREVVVPEGAGTLELTVTPLPPTTVDSSLYAEGTESLRVLSTRLRTRAVLEDGRDDVRKLNDEIKLLHTNREKLAADLKAIQTNMQTLTKLEGFTAANITHAAEKAALNSEAAIGLAKYVMDTRIETTRGQTALEQQVQGLQEKIDFAQRRLRELAAAGNRTERDAVLVVEKADPAAGKVRLNYLVDGATWRPMYKLRAGKTAKDQVQLEYLAAVTQNTGEEWSAVKVTLSTAQPTLNAAPPELHTLQVAVVPRGGSAPAQLTGMELEEQSKHLRARAQKDFNEKQMGRGISLYNSAAALDQSWELLNPEAAVKRGCALAVREGPSVTYHLATQLTVPSRGDEQVLEMARLEMPPEYYYKAVPVLTSHVYRLADLTNRSTYVLLPGEATMYIGSDFVGQMNMPLVAIGEQFTVGFGVDPQMQVQRVMTDKSKTTQGGNQALRYEYRILVSSYKAERVKLQVWDRLPHAESDAVGISLVKTSLDLSKDALYLREQRPTNLLRWDVMVDPGTTGEKALAINYEFKMELDRQMSIGSFQSASVSPAPLHPANMPAVPQMGSVEEAKIKAALAKLTAEDRKLAEAQVWCAIDQESRLGEMGPIFKVMVKGRPVFLCCKGCEKRAQTHPDETLAQLDKLMSKAQAKH